MDLSFFTFMSNYFQCHIISSTPMATEYKISFWIVDRFWTVSYPFMDLWSTDMIYIFSRLNPDIFFFKPLNWSKLASRLSCFWLPIRESFIGLRCYVVPFWRFLVLWKTNFGLFLYRMARYHNWSMFSFEEAKSGTESVI